MQHHTGQKHLQISAELQLNCMQMKEVVEHILGRKGTVDDTADQAEYIVHHTICSPVEQCNFDIAENLHNLHQVHIRFQEGIADRV